jgi:hypothetical protein
MTETISQILQERGARYGAFDAHAAITQRLKADNQTEGGKQHLWN